LAVLSPPFIYTLYGTKWLAAAAPLSVLMVAQVLSLAFGMNWELFVLRGETGRQAKYEITRSAIGVLFFSIGCLFSLVGAAVGRVADSLVGLIVYFPHVRRLAKTEKHEIPAVYRDSALATVAAVAPSLALMIVYRWSPYTPLPLVALAVMMGIAMWAGVLALIDHPLKNEALVLLHKLRRKPASQL
jgi:O-antigen/teichoic acid export membrane protein